MEYSDERINDLVSVFDTLMKHSHEYRDMSHVYRSVVEKPARRFYVSERRAAIVIAAMLRGEPVTAHMRPTKRDMFREIYSRVVCLRRRMPHASLIYLCRRVVAQPAPRFYLMPDSAKTMICKARREWRKKHHRKFYR